MGLQKIERNSVSDAVYDQLSREILEGRMSAGQTLPAERALCQMLGVNRGAVREALKRLSQAGLVQVRHGGGATVLDFRETAGMDLLSGLLFSSDGGIDMKVARSVIEMRAAIGPDVARRCAQRRGPALVERLRGRYQQMLEDVDDVESLQTHDIEFWQLLVEGADNIAYRLAYNSLRATYEQVSDVLVHTLQEEFTHMGDHEALLEAIVAGDPDVAETTARTLLRRGTEPMLALIDVLTPNMRAAAVDAPTAGAPASQTTKETEHDS